MNAEKLISSLFETKAVRVCPQDKPFWYTSGTIGPYYINTHFLYGSEDKANELLELIDNVKHDKHACPGAVLSAVKQNYGKDAIYRDVIDTMVGFLKQNIDLTRVSLISGGERRDWFFSLIIADMLNLPHITIYKDLSVVLSQSGKVTDSVNLYGAGVLHIADLITEASSYERAWIPAINAVGGKMIYSLAVVDRMQGGAEVLKSRGVEPFALVNIDKGLFEKAHERGLINGDQLDMIIAYLENPKGSMREFLIKHPDFLASSLLDKKTGERARLCVEKDLYGLK